MIKIPENLLEGKNVLVGVSGSIAAYKSLELVRLFIKAGANVRVVMSEAATKFVTPLSFETLSRHKVLLESTEDWGEANFNHISVTAWADLYVIAPCTANTIAKLANAIADNLLTQCALAYSGVKIIAPSANTNMIKNPIIEGSLKMLKVANFEVVSSQVKELACQTTGDGAMAEPIEIFYEGARELLKEEFWMHRRVVVTGGGTIEKIDDVRFISNFSSGKQASALAFALYLRGADVNLISTKFDEPLPKNMHKLKVESGDEMREYLVDSIRIAKKGVMSKPSLIHDESLHLIQKEPFLFMAAAVGDYVPKHPQFGKLKKSMLGEEWEIALTQSVDILSSINKDGIKVVAFKAEMDASTAVESATSLLTQKDVDAVCLNVLENSSSFGSETNSVQFITQSSQQQLATADKLSVSLNIIKSAESL